MQYKPFIITIVGPESSGKTTLARELASSYGALWVPEYARKYLDELGRPYQENDLNRIAQGQLEAISALLGQRSSLRSLQSSVGSLQSAVLGFQSAVGSWQSSVLSSPSGPLKGVNMEARTQYSFLTFQREEFGDVPRPLVIVDSGMLSLRIWARIKYGITIPVVEHALKEDATSLYILTRPVLEWEADPIREAPLLLDRVWIYNQYLKELSTIPMK